jgi:hypothetical protein
MMWRIDRFGLRRPALPQKYAQHDHRAEAQEFALPVLKGVKQKLSAIMNKISNPILSEGS